MSRKCCRSILLLKKPLINNDILNLFTFYLTDEKNIILEDVVWCIKQLSDNSTNIVKKLLDNDIFIRSLIDTLFKPQVKQDVKSHKIVDQRKHLGNNN